MVVFTELTLSSVCTDLCQSLFLLLPKQLRHTLGEVFLWLLITAWTLGHCKHPGSNNLLYLQRELHAWSGWTQVLIHCCRNDSEYQTDECLFYKTAVVLFQAWQGTSWDHNSPLNWLCSVSHTDRFVYRRLRHSWTACWSCIKAKGKRTFWS